MSAQQPVGARVKFRDDHPDYPGMVGTVDDVLTLPGGEPMVSVALDSVPATADEIQPWDDDADAAQDGGQADADTTPWTGMYFTRYEDGTIGIHNPEEAPTWALYLLESADADNGLTWENGVVTFTGRDGVYSWREVGRDDLGYGHVVVRTVRQDPPVVTPSRTDRQPPTSATQAKGGQPT